MMDKGARGRTEESSKLTLQIIDSEKLEVGTEYHIQATGLKGSVRDAHDGCTYGGCQPADEFGTAINDILLSDKEEGVGSRHFVVQYNSDSDKYMLQDLNDGTGTFIRLDLPYQIRNNNIISFGDSHMIITLENYLNPSVTLKFIDGPKVDHI